MASVFKDGPYATIMSTMEERVDMKISKHGQVTIPSELRQQTGFLPDVEVEFIPDEGGTTLRLVRKQPDKLAEIKKIYGKKSFGQTTDELMRLLRQ